MTNELLAEYIQQGENDELIPLLWEKVKQLLFMKAEQAYRYSPERFQRHGVDVWDIKQECYDVYLQALRGYKSEQGYKFTSYLQYPFKNAVRGLLGERQRQEDALNNCASLDETLTNDSGDDVNRYELIPDETASRALEQVDAQDEQRYMSETLQAAISELPEREQAAIHCRYYEGLPLKAIGDSLNVSAERVRQLERAAFKTLRRNKRLRDMYAEINYYKPRSVNACMLYGPIVETTAERREYIESLEARARERLAAVEAF